MSKRQFLMLAHEFDESKHSIENCFISTKLDGMRCYWDGGVSRNVVTNEVPWANTEKDYRFIDQDSLIATGLWSRNGKVIHAPDWWLDGLPSVPLDGELWMGNGSFQECMSSVRKIKPIDSEWKKITYWAFDMPGYTPLMDGTIDDIHHKKEMKGCFNWATNRKRISNPYTQRFTETLKLMEGLGSYPHLRITPQFQLPSSLSSANNQLWSMLDEITTKGGEGLMIRRPDSIWTPCRTWNLLKVKKWLYDEGTVVGYCWGMGKFLGMMGAMIITNNDGKQFEIGGFTNDERQMVGLDTLAPMHISSGTRVAIGTFNRSFPIGTRVMYRYRELSKTGIPLKAQYCRKVN